MAKLAAGFFARSSRSVLRAEEQGAVLLAVAELAVGPGAGQEEVLRPLRHRRQLRVVERPGREAAGEGEEPLVDRLRRRLFRHVQEIEGVLPAIGEVGLHDLVAPPLQAPAARRPAPWEWTAGPALALPRLGPAFPAPAAVGEPPPVRRATAAGSSR